MSGPATRVTDTANNFSKLIEISAEIQDLDARVVRERLRRSIPINDVRLAEGEVVAFDEDAEEVEKADVLHFPVIGTEECAGRSMAHLTEARGAVVRLLVAEIEKPRKFRKVELQYLVLRIRGDRFFGPYLGGKEAEKREKEKLTRAGIVLRQTVSELA